MQIAIVEDDLEQQRLLERLINDYAIKHKLNVTIDCFADGIYILETGSLSYDLIYLDIEMKHLDGMTTAKGIREQDDKVILVFVTNFVQFAIEGYSVNAFDFLLKPLSIFSFSEHFKKVLARYRKSRPTILSIKTADGMVNVNVSELLFVESEGHSLYFHTVNDVYRTRRTMKETETELLPLNFFRCNHGYLVNLAHVKGIEDNQVIIGEEALQISRPRKKEFLAVLNDFLGGE